MLVRDGLTYRERPDLGTFDEGVFESLFIEIVRGGGRRNDVVGVVYRPPGGDIGGFNTEMARVLGLLNQVHMGQRQTFWENSHQGVFTH